MLVDGWGPIEGFPVEVGYNATTPFQIVADTVGDYSATIVLYDVTNNETIATSTISFTVIAQ